MSITVVDSIMGSGKSTWVRNHMNSHPEKRWWYCAIRLKEANIPVNACPELNFQEPSDENKKKTDDLISLIKKGVNIASTHQLLVKIKQTPELLELIASQGYTLVIDEVPDGLVDDMNKTKDDIEGQLESKTFTIDDATGKLTWLKDDYSIHGHFQDVRQKLKTGDIYYNGETLIALYNPDIFKAFQHIFVLTYLFNGSRMRMYFDFYGLDYEIRFISDGDLSSEKPDNLAEKQKINNLIDIYDDYLYEIGIRKYNRYTFSQSWYNKPKYYAAQASLFNNTYNYLHNKIKAKSKETMFTVFLNVYNRNPSLLSGYKKSFVECSAKATNDYRDRTVLAYLVNMFQDPEIEKFFIQHRITQDENAFARCSMLQWIWRSAIRDDKPIHLFIPSPRMREMLNKWLTESD